jgi:DNA-binding CsgD family transcriptional regulator
LNQPQIESETQEPSKTSETPSTGETSPSLTAQPEGAGSELQSPEEPNYAQYKDDLILARREQAYRLRIVERRTYDEIATILQVSKWTAINDVRTITGIRIKALIHIDKELIAKHDEIYEGLLNKWLPVAMSEDEIVLDKDGRQVVDNRSLNAVDRVTKILGDQAKLHGLGQAGKAAGGAQEYGKAVGEHVLQAMQRLAQGRFVRAKTVEGRIVEDEQTY